MVIRIPKIKLNLLVCVALWNMMAAVMIGFLGVPRSILYFTDALNIWLFLTALKHCKYSVPRQSVFAWIILFFVIGVISSISNFSSPILTIWGLRQNFRFFLFFYSCVILMTENDIWTILKAVEIAFWVSVPLCTYEGLFVTYSQDVIVGDMVGGIYYKAQGANAPLNVILVVYSIYTVLRCLDGKIRFKRMLVTIAASMWMAILSELKVFIVELIVIIVIAMITHKISWKTILLFALGVLSINIVIIGFVSVNAKGRSYYNVDFFSIQSMIEYVTGTTGYDGGGDINRFTAVHQLADMFFRDNLLGLLFGYGIGSAEYSKLTDMLTSQFYNQYSYLHYQYFTHSFVFIETGLMGLISYLMIFISMLDRGYKKLKNTQWKWFYIIVVLMVMLWLIYNTTMRNEFCAYILYAILAIPFAKNFDYRVDLK